MTSFNELRFYLEFISQMKNVSRLLEWINEDSKSTEDQGSEIMIAVDREGGKVSLFEKIRVEANYRNFLKMKGNYKLGPKSREILPEKASFATKKKLAEAYEEIIRLQKLSSKK